MLDLVFENTTLYLKSICVRPFLFVCVSPCICLQIQATVLDHSSLSLYLPNTVALCLYICLTNTVALCLCICLHVFVFACKYKDKEEWSIEQRKQRGMEHSKYKEESSIYTLLPKKGKEQLHFACQSRVRL